MSKKKYEMLDEDIMDKVTPGAQMLGILSAFDNRYQAYADIFFSKITWKQFFVLACIELCKESPTLNELSELIGTSHQNVKQILLKLEQKGFVKMKTDPLDKRKQRILLAEGAKEFQITNSEKTLGEINKIFAGISEKKIYDTIRVLEKMDYNLRKLQ